MPSSENEQELVAVNLYRQSYEDLERLRTRFPEKAVVNLAREVLRRLADRSNATQTDTSHVEELCSALIDSDLHKATQVIEKHYETGLSVQDIYLGLLAPAANQLGEWWNQDTVTFADVTIGVGRIYAIMRSLRIRFPPTELPRGKAAFFTSVPGDTHNLGIKMAADLCRQRGWEIDMEVGLDHDSLVERIVDSGHLLIGISAGGRHTLAGIARLVLALRISQPGLRILVSGHIAQDAEDNIRLMQVDSIVKDFDGAVAELERHWAELIEFMS